jgi:CubicO group peptidase (beta-lactamase class C family)
MKSREDIANVRVTRQFVTACTNSLLLLALICASLHAQTLTDRADLLLAKWNRKGEPGMAVLLIRNGRVEYRKGFGLADLDKRTPVTPDTQFSVESVAKQFIAMDILIR